MPGPIVTLNEESLKTDLREFVRRTVEDILNGLLEERAGDLVGSVAKKTSLSGQPLRPGRAHVIRGGVTTRLPKLKGMRFITEAVGPTAGVRRALSRP